MLWNLPYLGFTKTLSWKNIDLARKDMSNKLMIYRSNRKKRQNSASRQKGSYLKRIRGYNTGKEGGESRHSFPK